MSALRPFAAAAGITIHGLDVETDEDSLVLSGTLTACRDERGLADLRALRDVLVAAVAALEADASLPDVAPAPKRGPVVRNPFA